MAVVVATGVTADRRPGGPGRRCRRLRGRGVLAGVPAHLKQRGLAGVRLVISDQHAGLVAALGRVFQGVGHQRCRVHFARNLLALVPKSHKDMVAAVFRTVFAQPDRGDGRGDLGHRPRPARAAFPKIGPLMDDAKAEVLAFTAFPRSHWREDLVHQPGAPRGATAPWGGERPSPLGCRSSLTKLGAA